MEELELTAALRDFTNRRVLIVGDVMLDRYVWGTATRLSPEAPIPIIAKQRTSSSPGGAANVAANVVALGGNPVLMGVAGNGPEAEDLEAALRAVGVSPENVVLSATRRTTIKTRIIAHGQQLLRVDEEQTDLIDSELADQLFTRIERAFSSISGVIVSDYAKGVLTPELLGRLIARARELDLPVVVDPKGREYSRYSGATLLTPNRSEAFLALGIQPDSEVPVDDVGARLMDSLAIDALLITEGESGMTLFERHNRVHLPASARSVYDVTGAGDAVIATLGLALGGKASLRTATYLANLAGGLAVEQIGTATVSAAALESVLRDKSYSLPVFGEATPRQANQ